MSHRRGSDQSPRPGSAREDRFAILVQRPRPAAGRRHRACGCRSLDPSPNVEVLRRRPPLDKVGPRAARSEAARTALRASPAGCLAHGEIRPPSPRAPRCSGENAATAQPRGPARGRAAHRHHVRSRPLFEATSRPSFSMSPADAVDHLLQNKDKLGLTQLPGVRPSCPRRSSRAARPRGSCARQSRASSAPGRRNRDRSFGFDTTFLVRSTKATRSTAQMLLFFTNISDAGSGTVPGAGTWAWRLREPGQVRRGGRPRLPRRSDRPVQQPVPASWCWRRSSRALATDGASRSRWLFLDLDYFKSINDTHGHVVGSKLLVEVARVLKNCVRDNDVACRWGGDEYVRAAQRGTDSGGALKVAERIRRAIESHRFLAREGFSLSISTCIGIASYPEHAQDQERLLDFADRAMYRARRARGTSSTWRRRTSRRRRRAGTSRGRCRAASSQRRVSPLSWAIAFAYAPD